MTRAALATLLVATFAFWPAASHARVEAQAPWVIDWLREYASGDRPRVIARLTSIGDARTLEADLERLAPAWIESKEASPDGQRRVLAAFAMDVAAVKLTQGARATSLVEWGCRQIRRQKSPGDFERRWHLAAFALLGGGVDPDALEAHVTHMKFQFPREERLPLERGIASELRTAPFVASRMTASERTRAMEDAARRFREASLQSTESPSAVSVRVEALVRLSHAELSLNHGAAAMDALVRAEADLVEPDVMYLARLFRGMAAERIGQPEAARAFYQAALSLRPGAASATTALSALEFGTGARADADARTAAFLRQSSRPVDPWVTYFPGDYRHADALVAAMREALR